MEIQLEDWEIQEMQKGLLLERGMRWVEEVVKMEELRIGQG